MLQLLFYATDDKFMLSKMKKPYYLLFIGVVHRAWAGDQHAVNHVARIVGKAQRLISDGPKQSMTHTI